MKKLRKCLKCGTLFNSLSKSNRICPPCSRKNKDFKGLQIYDIPGFTEQHWLEIDRKTRTSRRKKKK